VTRPLPSGEICDPPRGFHSIRPISFKSSAKGVDEIEQRSRIQDKVPIAWQNPALLRLSNANRDIRTITPSSIRRCCTSWDSSAHYN
jgi:hypothetical protein